MSNEDVPRKDKKDLAQTVAKIALNAIPYAGGPLAFILDEIIKPSIEKRRDEFLKDLNERIKKLEDEGLGLKDLADNEVYVDIVTNCVRSALLTREKEKRRALRNIILNATEGKTPDESLIDIFINYVNILTDWHIIILKEASRLNDYLNEFGTYEQFSIFGLLCRKIPNLNYNNHRDFIKKIWQDLYLQGLVSIDADVIFAGMTGSGTCSKRTTSLAPNLLNLSLEMIWSDRRGVTSSFHY